MAAIYIKSHLNLSRAGTWSTNEPNKYSTIDSHKKLNASAKPMITTIDIFLFLSPDGLNKNRRRYYHSGGFAHSVELSCINNSIIAQIYFSVLTISSNT